jgi:two-component system, OmpR family, response regulator TctD
VSDPAQRFTTFGLPVEFVLWPAELERRDVLARAAVPRLLLVAPDAVPPDVIGVDEDWVRLPATASDVLARATQLLRFDALLRTDEPYIDDHRVLHRAGVTVPLTIADASIMSLLLRNAGTIVHHADLESEVWNGAAPSRDAIDAAIYRLRRRVCRLSLCIRSVRGQGFVLNT